MQEPITEGPFNMQRKINTSTGSVSIETLINSILWYIIHELWIKYNLAICINLNNIHYLRIPGPITDLSEYNELESVSKACYDTTLECHVLARAYGFWHTRRAISPERAFDLIIICHDRHVVEGTEWSIINVSPASFFAAALLDRASSSYSWVYSALRIAHEYNIISLCKLEGRRFEYHLRQHSFCGTVPPSLTLW